MIPDSYATYILNKQEKQRFLILLLVSSVLVAYLFYNQILLALMVLPVIKKLEEVYKKMLARKRSAELTLQFKDLLFSLSSSMAAGRQMREALFEGRDNMKLIYSDRAPLVLELNHMVKCMSESKETEDDVLRNFAKRSNIEDIENFVEVYFTCRSTGGNLETVVMKGANVIMDKISIEKEISTITAQKKFEAKILTGIPLLIIALLQLTSPDYLEVMYTTVTGRILMTLSLLMIGVAFLISMKITDIRV
ncbi:MAG: hypothetical protein RR131_09460 [Anaerovorax sp.]